jgi:hypothetical protein
MAVTASRLTPEISRQRSGSSLHPPGGTVSRAGRVNDSAFQQAAGQNMEVDISGCWMAA